MTPPAARLRVTVLPEYLKEHRPHSSPHIRLLRPLTHPGIADRVHATFRQRYRGEPADVVIVDRLWCPEISHQLVDLLERRVRGAGAKLVVALDDNLLDPHPDGHSWPNAEHTELMAALLAGADAAVVTTEILRARVATLQPNVFVVHNALDERLVVGGRLPERASPWPGGPVTIGYMGTLTHAEDLRLVLPALHAIHRRHGPGVRFEFLGVASDARALADLAGLPVYVRTPPPEALDYPLFMPWFTATVRWDIAIAPLVDSAFNRCKSDIKHLDYAAIAAAGVFSEVPAYAGSVRHGATGLLAANVPEAWTGALDRLVRDAELRRHLAKESWTSLRAHRTLAHRAADWLPVLRSLA